MELIEMIFERFGALFDSILGVWLLPFDIISTIIKI